jgi:hypothetical protein
VANWTWYEWVGVFAPLGILWWFSSADVRGARPVFHSLSRSLVPFGMLFTLAAVALNASPKLENYTRLQPMRALHLLYVVFFVLVGGWIGEYVLHRKTWHWPAFFGPLAAGMCLVQLVTYPASAHVEWPGALPANPWTAAFLWIRSATPKDAVFAIDPYYMSRPGEDMHGFRAVAERSVLADAVKDSGAVSLFPGLAEHWKGQVDAGLGDPMQLQARYPVTWIVTAGNGPAGWTCPYRNGRVAVCLLPGVCESR